MLVDTIDILMEQVRGLQFKRLELNAAAGGAKPVWFSIDSELGQAREGDAAVRVGDRDEPEEAQPRRTGCTGPARRCPAGTPAADLHARVARGLTRR